MMSRGCSSCIFGPMTTQRNWHRGSRRRSTRSISKRVELLLWRGLLLAVMLTLPALASGQTAGVPLTLEAKIPLGPVNGRIDHLAVDLKRQRLFVAELGNDSIGVVDLSARRAQSTMLGLKEPQGIAYEPSTDTVYVANAGDGSARILRAEDLTAIGRIDLGDDA